MRTRNKGHKPEAIMASRFTLLQVGNIGTSLYGRNGNGEVTCPLIDLLTATVSILLNLLHLRNQDGHQLHKD